MAKLPQAAKLRLTATANTDASFCPHTNAGGWAVWLSIDGGTKIRQAGQFKQLPQSSHQAELWAALIGVHYAIKAGCQMVLVQSDCKGALNDLKKETEWLRGRIEVRTKWIRSHTGRSGARYYVNDWCDRFARKHMQQMRKTIRAAHN